MLPITKVICFFYIRWYFQKKVAICNPRNSHSHHIWPFGCQYYSLWETVPVKFSDLQKSVIMKNKRRCWGPLSGLHNFPLLRYNLLLILSLDQMGGLQWFAIESFVSNFWKTITVHLTWIFYHLRGARDMSILLKCLLVCEYRSRWDWVDASSECRHVCISSYFVTV